MSNSTNSPELDSLTATMKSEWGRLFETSPFFREFEAGHISKDLYALWLIETYHYTRHNSRNQALVGVRNPGDDPQYQRFCFQHAADEAGHEQMALHDLRALGYEIDKQNITRPLPETQTLIAYLYWISTTGIPSQRLGYSFWAENCYEFILPPMAKMTESLSLTSAQTTFFVAHSEIDVEHSQQVQAMLLRQCNSEEDWQAVREVMITSLRLTGQMLDAVYSLYQRTSSPANLASAA